MDELIKKELETLKVRDQISENLSIAEFMNQIKINVDEWRKMHSYYICALMEVETKFKVLNQEFSLQYDRNPIESIKSRIKSPESLANKIIRKHLPLTFKSVEENINDVAGIRIICSFPEDIYMLAECIKKQDDIKVLKIKDYIKNPKENGYRGLHYIVEIPIFLHDEKKLMKVEIQFRTIAMDFWACLEHKLRYKKNLKDDVLKSIEKSLLECSKEAAKLDIKMQKIRTSIEKNQ